jgi:D-tyrosyl-tRNA(Tyr) deacylase
MRVVMQRVTSASVEVADSTPDKNVRGQARSSQDRRIVGRIGRGLLVYLSVGKGDSNTDAEFIAEKLTNLRIFADEAGKMNRSILEVGGEILIVSNFTLHGDCRRGRRWSRRPALTPPTNRRTPIVCMKRPYN